MSTFLEIFQDEIDPKIAEEIAKIESMYSIHHSPAFIPHFEEVQRKDRNDHAHDINNIHGAGHEIKLAAESEGNSTLKKPLVIDYWQSWASDWMRTDLMNTPEYVNVINIAFAIPNGQGDIVWNDDNHPKRTKEVIQALQKQNKKVLISIGGGNCHADAWNLAHVNIDKFAANIKKFIDSYGLNGGDIDYEAIENRALVVRLIQSLRKIMPKDKYLITYAAWSIGAYGIKNHEHPEWNGNDHKGIDIPILSKIGDDLDWVNVMSYDAFDPHIKYNPIEAVMAYQALLKNQAEKVALGIIVGPHSWPAGYRTSSRQVAPWLEFAIKQKFCGVMFWSLNKDVSKETLESNGAFKSVLSKLLPVKKPSPHAAAGRS